MQSDISQNALQINSIKDTLKLHTTIQDSNEKKIKEINETVYKIDNVLLYQIMFYFYHNLILLT